MEVSEGAVSGTDDILFLSIGDALPVTRSSSNFDADCVPAQSLAVSNRFGLTFIAHKKGVYVIKTAEAVRLAKEAKETKEAKTVEDASAAFVPLVGIHLLCLSKDSLYLVACVGGSAHFFNVPELLRTDNAKPSQSQLICESHYIKTFAWSKGVEEAFIVLTSDGHAVSGKVGSSFDNLQENVLAADWSPDGKCIAFWLKDNKLHVLSSSFEEKFSLSLPSQLQQGFYDNARKVQGEVMKWARLDCIIVGCISEGEEDEELQYEIHTILSRSGRISEKESDTQILVFDCLFPSLDKGILPQRKGPYLLLEYLDTWNIAVMSNRREIADHIALLGLGFDTENEVVRLELEDNDRGIPRIELQENGDENIVVGLGIDRTMVDCKVRFSTGDRLVELPPSPVLLCLTLEGKLVLFSIARKTIEAYASSLIFTPTELPNCSLNGVEAEIPKTNENNRFFNDTGVSDAITSLNEDGNHDSIVNTKSVMKSDVLSSINKSSNLVNMESSTTNEQQKTVCSADTVTVTNEKLETLHFDRSLKETDSSSTTSNTGIMVNNLSEDNKYPRVNFASTHASESLTSSSTTENLKSNFLTGNLSSVTMSNLQQNNQETFSSTLTSNSNQLKMPLTSGGQGLDQRSEKPSQGVNSFPGSNKSSQNNTIQISTGIGSSHQSFLRTGVSSTIQGMSFSNSTQGGLKAGVFSTIQPMQSSSSSLQSGLKTGTYSTIQGTTSIGSLPGTGLKTGGFSAVPSYGSSPQSGLKTSIFSATEETTSTSSPFQSGLFEKPQTLWKTPENVSLKKNSESLNFIDPRKPNVQLSNRTSVVTEIEADFACEIDKVRKMSREIGNILMNIEGEKTGSSTNIVCFKKESVIKNEEEINKITEAWKLAKEDIARNLLDIQNVRDKTMQVDAWRIYIQSIVEQSFDIQYQYLRKSQKLSPELEVKRKQILKLDQRLKSEILELERHLQSLEFKNFGEPNSGFVRHQSENSQSSRQVQSIQSIYNTVNNQLTIAEKLVESLSQQMRALNISPLPESQHSKSSRESIFKYIGLSPEKGSFLSPDVRDKTQSCQSFQKVAFSPSSSISKGSPVRMSSMTQSLREPESMRRRRDMKNSGWANCETTKTTVKRPSMSLAYAANSGKQISQKMTKTAPLRASSKNFELENLESRMLKEHMSEGLLYKQDLDMNKELKVVSKAPSQTRNREKDFPENTNSALFKTSSVENKFLTAFDSKNVNKIIHGHNHVSDQSKSGATYTNISNAFDSTGQLKETTDFKLSNLGSLSKNSASIDPSRKEILDLPPVTSCKSITAFQKSSQSTLSFGSSQSTLSFGSASSKEKKTQVQSSLQFSSAELTSNPASDFSSRFVISKECQDTASTFFNAQGESMKETSAFDKNSEGQLSAEAVSSPTIEYGSNEGSKNTMISPYSPNVSSTSLTEFTVAASSQNVTTKAPLSTFESSSSGVSSSNVSTVKASTSVSSSDVGLSSPSSFSQMPLQDSSSVASSKSTLIGGSNTYLVANTGASLTSTPSFSGSSLSSNIGSSPKPTTLFPSSSSTGSASSLSTMAVTNTSSGQIPSADSKQGILFSVGKSSSGVSHSGQIPSVSNGDLSSKPITMFTASGSFANFEASVRPPTASSMFSSAAASPFSITSTSTSPFGPVASPSIGLPTLSNQTTVSNFGLPVSSQQDQPPSSTASFTQISPSPFSFTTSETGGSSASTTSNLNGHEEDMEEESSSRIDPVNTGFGGFNAFGLGSTPSSTHKGNPFGGPTINSQSPAVSASFSVPSGQLFRPASFNVPTTPAQPNSNSGPFGSSSFGSITGISPGPASATGFGQPAQPGPGQHALGSALGSFGQSRQIGFGGGVGSNPTTGIGSGFANVASGGFASAATSGGGFASAATGGRFGSAAIGGGGFSSVATGGGFGGMGNSGGFAGTANSPAGSGFAFGGSGHSSFGQGTQNQNSPPPPNLFTQIRK